MGEKLVLYVYIMKLKNSLIVTTHCLRSEIQERCDAFSHNHIY